MLKNYFKIAFRNLSRNKGFTFLNITGLVVGMAGAMLIGLWIMREVSVDRFHENGEQIYQAWNRDKVDGEIWCWTTTPKPLGPVLVQDYPEINKVARYSDAGNLVYKKAANNLKGNSVFVDSTFLQMFSFPLISGDLSTALDEPMSVVITEELALKLFGTNEAVNQMVTVENRIELKVTGVLKSLPSNTEFDFEALIPWSLMVQIGYSDNSWSNNSVATYVELEKGVNISQLNEKVQGVTMAHRSGSTTEVFLYPLEESYLRNEFVNGVPIGGKIDLVYFFGMIAILIIAIACINFMNLSTARSEKRAKEVGIRKLSGAHKGMLVSQFLMESFLLTTFSAILAFIVVQLLLPSFNILTGVQLSIPFTNVIFWSGVMGFILITSLLAGSYPAFFLSSFQPVKVLKGSFKKSGSQFSPRKILVVSQFTFAIILIASTFIIKQQIEYAQNRSKGYDQSHLVYHNMNEEIDNGFVSFREEAIKLNLVEGMTKSMSPITHSSTNSWGMEWEGKNEENKQLIHRFGSDIRPVEIFGLSLVEGRDIDVTKYATDSTAILLNEEAVKVMGFEEPIGQIISDGPKYHVVGVVKDFVIGSPFEKTIPLVIESSASWFNAFHIKLNSELNTKENLASIQLLFSRHYPNIPFEFEFVDEAFAKNYQEQERFADLITLFSGLAIIISCLGLFGLSAYAAEQRRKEIGVRKVLGASVSRILVLLSSDFVKLVLIAIVIAIPVSWYLMSEWLLNFDYRTAISADTFIITAIIALAIAILTVIGQAYRTANLNPVNSLKNE
jgi:ABC-type antimicrobial peptide transport system permease subunit